jgi:hypothetical protein
MKIMWNMLFTLAGAEAHGCGSIVSSLIDTVISGRILKGIFG